VLGRTSSRSALDLHQLRGDAQAGRGRPSASFPASVAPARPTRYASSITNVSPRHASHADDRLQPAPPGPSKRRVSRASPMTSRLRTLSFGVEPGRSVGVWRPGPGPDPVCREGEANGLRTTALGHSGRWAPKNRRPFADLRHYLNGRAFGSKAHKATTQTPFMTRCPAGVGESGPQGTPAPGGFLDHHA
jgi:hypothetical protein